MRVRYVIIFRTEGLDLDGVVKDLSKYGNVTDVDDDTLTSDGTPVKLVYMDSSIVQLSLVKMAYHLAPLPENDYIFFPMENEEERRKVIAM